MPPARLTGTTTLTYNAANELTSVSYPDGLSLTFTYNAQGQRTQSVDQSGYTINYSYDALGRLSELTDGSGNLIVQYTYNSLGQLAEKLNGNGTYTTYAYDAAGNLTSEVNYAAGGTTVNSSFTYTYNVLNEMTSMTDAAGNVTTYGYDATGQLTQVTLPGGATITYVYNAAGDRTRGRQQRHADQLFQQRRQRDHPGRLDHLHLRRQRQPGHRHRRQRHDHLHLQRSEPTGFDRRSDGTVTTFQYSPLGFLVGENVNGTQTNYLVDPTGLGNVVASYNGSGSLIADYNYGLGLVSQTGPSGTGYYDFDASGNTVGITGVQRHLRQPVQLPAVRRDDDRLGGAAEPVQLRRAGRGDEGDAPVWTTCGRAYYSAATGQFASNDPLGLHGGDVNVRRYVHNHPTNLVDPSGTMVFCRWRL